MCNVFRCNKNKKKRKHKSKDRMPCWALFYDNNKRKDKEKQRKNSSPGTTSPSSVTVEEEQALKTPSAIADLPSTSVKSIGADREVSLSKPMPSSAFEWDNLSKSKPKVNEAIGKTKESESTLTTDSQQTRKEVENKIRSPAKKLKDGEGKKKDKEKKNQADKTQRKESALAKLLKKVGRK